MVNKGLQVPVAVREVRARHRKYFFMRKVVQQQDKSHGETGGAPPLELFRTWLDKTIVDMA